MRETTTPGRPIRHRLVELELDILLANIEERHSGDTEQESRRGSNQSDENKMEEYARPDCRFRSSTRHSPICIPIG